MSHQEHETGPPKPPRSAQQSLRDNTTTSQIRKRAKSRANWPGADREGFASEVIYRLLNYEHKGNDIRNLYALADTIISRAAAEEAAKAKRIGTAMASEAIENLIANHSQYPSADSFSIVELLTDLDAVLEPIEELKRKVVRCRTIDRLSQGETAIALGIPIGTVKSREHRGLKEIRNDPGFGAYNMMHPDPD